MWERNWQQGSPPDDVHALCENYFWDPFRFDDFGFSALHKAYLGLSSDYNQILADTPRSKMDTADNQGRTVLSWAASCGDSKAVGRLLSCGADPDKAANAGWTPLQWAVYGPNNGCMDLLLDANAHPNTVGMFGFTPLHSAAAIYCQPQVIHGLVDHGADLASKNEREDTPIRVAICRNNWQAVSNFISLGVSVTTDDVKVAMQYSCSETLDILLAQWDVDSRDPADEVGVDLFHHAALHADILCTRLLAAKWPTAIDTDALTSSGQSVMDAALFRRDQNAEWAKKYHKQADSDPETWYKEFQYILPAIQANKSVGKSPEMHELTSKDDLESDTDSDDPQPETWQDAAEYIT